MQLLFNLDRRIKQEGSNQRGDLVIARATSANLAGYFFARDFDKTTL